MRLMPMPMRCFRGFALGATLTMMVLAGCKSTPPAPAAGVKNSDGSVTNPDGSVTYPAGTAQAAAAKPAVARTNPDGSITNPDGSVTYPAGTKRAKEESQESAQEAAREAAPREAAPRAAAPASTAGDAQYQAPAARQVRTIPSGTAVVVRVTQTLSASRNNPGDGFTGILDQGMMSGNDTVFPRGTSVSGTVVAAKGKGRFKGAGDIGIEVTSIGRERVSTTEYEKSSPGRGKRTGVFAGGGAGLGALIGGLAGGGKGAVIGGLAGAGAGTAAGAYTGNRDVVIPSESLITFRLTAPVTLR